MHAVIFLSSQGLYFSFFILSLAVISWFLESLWIPRKTLRDVVEHLIPVALGNSVCVRGEKPGRGSPKLNRESYQSQLFFNRAEESLPRSDDRQPFPVLWRA
jgi:hypothetical protein